jgi:hypothetical protein
MNLYTPILLLTTFALPHFAYSSRYEMEERKSTSTPYSIEQETLSLPLEDRRKMDQQLSKLCELMGDLEGNMAYSRAKSLWHSTEPTQHQKGIELLHMIAQDDENPYQCKALNKLDQNNAQGHIASAVNMLNIVRNDSHPNQWKAIQELADHPQYYAHHNALLPILSAIIKNEHHPHQVDAYHTLSSLLIDKRTKNGLWRDPDYADTCFVFWATLNRIIKQAHPQYFTSAKKVLWHNLTQADISITRSHLINIAQDPTHPLHWKALCHLWNSALKEKQLIVLPRLLHIAQNSEHQHYFPALVYVWQSGTRKNKASACEEFIKIAQNPNHPYYKESLLYLWKSNYEAYRAIARPIFKALIQDDTHTSPIFWGAIRALWMSRRQSDRRLAKETLRKILKEDSCSAHFWIAFGYFNTSKNLEDNELARSILIDIVKTNQHPHRAQALSLLWKSINSYERAIAQEITATWIVTMQSKQPFDRSAPPLRKRKELISFLQDVQNEHNKAETMKLINLLTINKRKKDACSPAS